MSSSLFILFFISVLNKQLNTQSVEFVTKGYPSTPSYFRLPFSRCTNFEPKCNNLLYTNLVNAILNGLRLKSSGIFAPKKGMIQKIRDPKDPTQIQPRLLQDHVLKPYIQAPTNYWSGPVNHRSNAKAPVQQQTIYPTRRSFSGNYDPGYYHSQPKKRPQDSIARKKPKQQNKTVNITKEIKDLTFVNTEFNDINKTAYFYEPKNDTHSIYHKFLQSLDKMERKYYKVSFDKLTENAPPGREENGISFAQSGVLLYLALMAIYSEVDAETKSEIDESLQLKFGDEERKMVINKTISSFPTSEGELKIRWAFRLVLTPNVSVTDEFANETSEIMDLHINHLNGTETPDVLTTTLNEMVALDSGGAMHYTFDEEELSEGLLAVLTSILYVRGQWRAAPTLLNGTAPFRDVSSAPNRTFCSIRINDVMRYAEFHEWDAEGVEISYATPGLTLLLLIPKRNSLRNLANIVSSTSIQNIANRLQTLRAAVTLPLYTLRMTLLLPNKLEAMGMPRLVDVNSTSSSLKLSHAVQRLMFWSEPGRNAFKDDGIEWDAPPEVEIIIDRPYIFFVRWHNITLLNGNFVL